nr:uncharacterized protein LOC112210297 [Halyomorpha halys]
MCLKAVSIVAKRPLWLNLCLMQEIDFACMDFCIYEFRLVAVTGALERKSKKIEKYLLFLIDSLAVLTGAFGKDLDRQSCLRQEIEDFGFVDVFYILTFTSYSTKWPL